MWLALENVFYLSHCLSNWFIYTEEKRSSCQFVRSVSCRVLSGLLFENLAALSTFLSLFLLAGWIKLLWNRIWRGAQGWPKITVWLKKWENGVAAKWKYSNVLLPQFKQGDIQNSRTHTRTHTIRRTQIWVWLSEGLSLHCRLLNIDVLLL